jgi:lipoprotein-releasing system ATP-binding protein
LASFRNQRIGFVFQDHYLLPQLTAIENVLVPAIARQAASTAAVTMAQQLLQRVGLADRQHHRPAELSGGERQRVALARALVNRPMLLMADEPTGNLDVGTAESITDLLLELQQRADPPTMMIVVTHSEALAGRMQRCMRLERGELTPAAQSTAVN